MTVLKSDALQLAFPLPHWACVVLPPCFSDFVENGRVVKIFAARISAGYRFEKPVDLNHSSLSWHGIFGIDFKLPHFKKRKLLPVH